MEKELTAGSWWVSESGQDGDDSNDSGDAVWICVYKRRTGKRSLEMAYTSPLPRHDAKHHGKAYGTTATARRTAPLPRQGVQQHCHGKAYGTTATARRTAALPRQGVRQHCHGKAYCGRNVYLRNLPKESRFGFCTLPLPLRLPLLLGTLHVFLPLFDHCGEALLESLVHELEGLR